MYLSHKYLNFLSLKYYNNKSYHETQGNTKEDQIAGL